MSDDTPTPPFLPGASNSATCPRCEGAGWVYVPVGTNDTPTPRTDARFQELLAEYKTGRILRSMVS